MRLPALAFVGLMVTTGAARGETVTMSAKPLSVFVQSFGVNMHREQGLELTDVDGLAGELRALGVATLRIANPAADQAQIAAGGVGSNQDFYLRLARAARIRYVVFLSSQPVLADELAAARVLAKAGALRGIEGINEANNFAVTYDGETTRTDDALLERLQADLYRAVKDDPELGSYPVYDYTGPARLHGFPRTGRADYATIHPYSHHGEQTRFGASVASRGGIQAVNIAQNYTGRVTAKAITENGYAAPGSGDAVPLAAQGPLIETMVSDAVLDGYDIDLVYELTDAPGDLYGFYDHEHRIKPSGVALGQLMRLMADPGVAATPMTMTFSFEGMPATARRSLFQASTGEIVLELWDEPQSSESPPSQVMINLPKRFASVTVYDGVTGVILSTAHEVAALVIALPGHPIIVKLR